MRPREFEDLTTTSITVPRSLLKQATSLKINISEICREAMAKALDNPEAIQKTKQKSKLKEKFKGIPRHYLNEMERHIAMKGTACAVRWAAEANKLWNVELSSQDCVNYTVGV